MSKITPAKSYEWKISLLFFSLPKKESLQRVIVPCSGGFGEEQH